MNKDKSIKDLKQYNDKIKMQLEYAKIRIYTLEKEIERLNNIIKEVREYINKISSEPNVFGHYAIDGNCKKYLLGILDKVNNVRTNN